jgi:hypothetical protein
MERSVGIDRTSASAAMLRVLTVAVGGSTHANLLAAVRGADDRRGRELPLYELLRAYEAPAIPSLQLDLAVPTPLLGQQRIRPTHRNAITRPPSPHRHPVMSFGAPARKAGSLVYKSDFIAMQCCDGKG